MTRVLALDTSGTHATVAILESADNGAEDGAPPTALASAGVGAGMRRGVDLFPALETALRTAGVKPRDLDLVAVGTGPGSYTGMRVGVTAARALAYAAGVPLLGVPSCDAWAAAVPSSPGATLAVVLDARVRAVYLALYDGGPAGWSRRGDPDVVAPAVASEALPDQALLVGDGFAAYAEHLGDRTPLTEPDRADAVHIAELALARFGRGERDRIESVLPLYLRKSEAERKWERTHA